jgi:hypothetical protein
MIAILDARALKLDRAPKSAPIPIVRASVAPATASDKPTAALKTSICLRMILSFVTFLRASQERLNASRPRRPLASAHFGAHTRQSNFAFDLVFFIWRSQLFNDEHIQCVPMTIEYRRCWQKKTQLFIARS